MEVYPQLTPISQGRGRSVTSTMDTSGLLSTSIPYTLCKTPFSDLLASLVYVVFLIIFVSVLAVKSRGIRDNYREASYIGKYRYIFLIFQGSLLYFLSIQVLR